MLSVGVLALLLATTGCSEEAGNISTAEESIDENVMTFAISHPADRKVQTRATDTAFETDDRIGVFISESDSPLEVSGNYVNNAALTYDGAQWTPDKTIYWNDGTYNIYNALAAYSVARHFGLTEVEVAQAFAENKRIFGRQELIHYGDKDIDLILVKNPVGLDEVLHMLNTEKDDYSLVALLNANHADGIDTSWIWDADFEGLDKEKIKKILVGGQRWHDMGFRLEIAGFDPGQMSTNPDDDSLIEEIKKLPTKKVYILSTYTAMLALRKKMAEKKIIKAGM